MAGVPCRAKEVPQFSRVITPFGSRNSSNVGAGKCLLLGSLLRVQRVFSGHDHAINLAGKALTDLSLQHDTRTHRDREVADTIDNAACVVYAMNFLTKWVTPVLVPLLSD